MTKVTLDHPPYILIIGQGRSGTNWLLDILDASEKTHCRNEPDEVPNSQLNYIRNLQYSTEAVEEVLSEWKTRIQAAKLCMSERDHHIETPKQHIYPLIQKTGLATFPTRPKIRRVLRPFFPEFRQGEFKVPWWMANENQLRQACAIFKINLPVAWFVNSLATRYPQIPMIHIVRHPGGYLNSALKRFLSKCTAHELEQELQIYQTMMKTAIQVYPEWQERVGDLSSMALIETIMWFWSFNNEMIYRGNKNNANYHLQIYENLVANPLDQSKKIYDFCQLPWNDAIEAHINQELTKSVWGDLKTSPVEIAQAWRKSLSSEHQSVINKILSASRIQFLWTD